MCLAELTNVNNEYSEKLQSRQHKEKEMIKLTWKVKELSDLNENGREIFSQVNLIISKLPTEECDRSVNIPRDLHEIRQKVCMEFCEREDDGHILKVNGNELSVIFHNVLGILAYWSELTAGWTTKFAAREVRRSAT